MRRHRISHLEWSGLDVRSRMSNTVRACFAVLFLSWNALGQSFPEDIVRLSPETEFSGFTWIVGSWTELIEAQASAFEYHAEGYEPFIVPVHVNGSTRYRVAFGRFHSREDAERNRPSIPPNVPSDAWIAEIRSEIARPRFERVELSRVSAAQPELSRAQFVWNDPVAGQVVEVAPFEISSSQADVGNPETHSFLKRHVLDKSRMDFGLLSQYDSNLDRVEDATNTFSYIPALFLRHEFGKSRPILVLNYFGARHNYTDVDDRNRWSHILNATLLPDQRGKLRYETALQLSRTVLSEERQLADDAQVRHRFEYRFSSMYRMRVYGTVRWERYVDDPDANAFRPNIGVTFRQRFDNGSNWDTELRLEKNMTDSERDQYRRLTFLIDYTVPVSSVDELGFEVVHRRRMYDHREIEAEGETVLRNDLRWSAGTSWARNLRSDLRLLFGYHFERRDSNDPGKIFEAHLVDLGLIYRL